jgi:hypothetical protein
MASVSLSVSLCVPLSLAFLASPIACSSETFHSNGPGTITEDGGASDAAAPGDGPVCGDTSADPNHCGACNHGCLGGACARGRCQPVALVKTASLASTLALDENFFFAGLQGGTGGLLECPLAGCAHGRGPSIEGLFVGGIAVDSNSVYLADLAPLGKVYQSGKGTVTKVPLADGDVTVLVKSRPEGLYVVSDGSGSSAPSIKRVDPTAVVTIATGLTPVRGIAFTSDRVLWTEPGPRIVHAALLNGTTPPGSPEVFLDSAMASGTGALGITVVANGVFIAGQVEGSILRCPSSRCSSPESIAVGGAPTLLGADGQNLFWYDGASHAVRACELGRCEKSARDLATALPDVFDLAVGTDAVYFTVRSADGGVFRVAK